MNLRSPDEAEGAAQLLGSRTAPQGGHEGRSRWVVALVFLVLLTEQSALGFQLIAPALTDFAVRYETTHVIWAITAFTLTGAVLTPLIGKLGDHFGKRRILMYAAAVSTIGCVISALAPTFQIFIAGRVLSATSVAFLPVTYALMRDVFPSRMREISISIATNGVGVVTIAGPFLAGFLIDNIGTSSIFWFVAAISVVGAVGTALLVPETSIRDHSRFDIVGIAGLVAGMFLLLLGISQVQDWGLTNPRTIGLLVAAVLILCAWWAWEANYDEPFVSTAVMRNRATTSVLFSFAFIAGAGVMMSSHLPTLLQTPRELADDYGFGVNATGVAGFLVLAGVLTVAGGVMVGILGRRYGFGPFLVLGGALTTVGGVGLASVTTDAWGPVIFYGICGLGAMVYAAGPNLMMQLAPSEQRGVSAGMLGLVGGVLGSLFAQLGGLILSENAKLTDAPMPVYTGSGVRWLFITAAVLAAVGALIALAIPKRPAQLYAQSGAPRG